MDRISFFKGEKRTVFATKYIKPQDKKQKEEKKENEKNTPDENPDSVFTDIRHDCDIGDTDMTVPDVEFNKNAATAGKASPVVKDGTQKLKAGTDYDKNVVFLYTAATQVTQKGSAEPISREADDPVDRADIVPAGTQLKAIITGSGGYQGTNEATFRVFAGENDISKAKVTIPDQLFTNEEVTLTEDMIQVSLKGTDLSSDDSEILSYEKNQTVGTATVLLHGTGSYGGFNTAKFKIVKSSMAYTVIFNANGGTGKMKNQLITKWVDRLAPNQFKNAGKTFVRWDTKADGTGEQYDDESIISSIGNKGKRLTLYAIWE